MSSKDYPCGPGRKLLGSVMLLLAGTIAIRADEATRPGMRPGPVASEGAYTGLDEPTIAGLRADFAAAVESMVATESAIRSMEARFRTEPQLWPPLAQAYRASLEGLVGKHSPRLLDKFNKVNAGISAFEGLIEAFPGSLELRFMRFAFYSQLPGLFGVGRYVNPDRAILTDMLEQGSDTRVPDSQKLEMILWILKEGRPDRTEASRLRAAAARLNQS